MTQKYLILLSLTLGSALSLTPINEVIKQTINQKASALKELNDNKKDPFIAKLFSNGMKTYSDSTKVQFIQQVDGDELSGFANFLSTSLRIPTGKKASFIDTVQASVWMDVNDWKELSFVFDMGKGQAKYVSVVAAANSTTNKLDFLIADIQSNFEIGDDIFVSTYTKKSFFGLFGSTKLVIKKVPAKMTEKSIDLIFKYFKIVAFERFAKFRSIPF